MSGLPGRRRWIVGSVVVGVGAVILSQLWWPSGAIPHAKALAQSTTKPERSEPSMRVSTIHPVQGGAPRQTSLPCTAHWYDYADLCAKVAGYLGSMDVDIGSRVTKGQVLARIDVPELERDVDHAAATLRHIKASVNQAQARVKSAMAEQRASQAACVRAEADTERWVAEETFRNKEYQRFRELNQSESVQAALVDEKMFQLQSAQAGRRSAETAILTAKEQANAAQARVELAEADLGVMRAQVEIAESGLAKANLLASFSKIISPYDGVVTARHFHVGEFIRAADKGTVEPLLMVGRTDHMRVVVHIPDRDVPFAHVGDPVTIDFDALPGRKFTGTLARIAYAEETKTRTMRAEVDLPNDKGLLVDQMYGRMQIQLEPANQSLTIPSVCLVGDLKENRGQVFVVEDGVAKLTSIAVGAHDGVNVQILEGLDPKCDLVIRPPSGLTEGTRVTGEPSRNAVH